MWNKIVRKSQTKTLSPRNRANWDMATGVSVQTEVIRSSLPQPILSCLQTRKVLLRAEGWEREPPLGFPETAPVPRDALDSEWHCSRGCSLHREGLYTTSNPSCPDPSWLPDICEGTPWEGICKEPFILQWRGNLIITREFLQVPGSTEWTLPSVAGWNAANTNTMEALKKAERLSTHSPCLFSPEMKGGLQVSRNCAFWLVFIDSEVLADRQTDRQAGRQGRVPLQWRRFFPSSPLRLSLLTLFTHCCGFSSWCWGKWQLPFTSLMLEACVPLGNTTVRLSATYCGTSIRDVATTPSFVSSLPAETWVKTGGLGWMLKVNSGWLLGVSARGLCEKEMCPCTVLSPIFTFPSLMQPLLIRSLIALL